MNILSKIWNTPSWIVLAGLFILELKTFEYFKNLNACLWSIGLLFSFIGIIREIYLSKPINKIIKPVDWKENINGGYFCIVKYKRLTNIVVYNEKGNSILCSIEILLDKNEFKISVNNKIEENFRVIGK